MTAQTLGLLAALAWPLPMIVALFMVVRAPALKFRLIWVAFCFVGVGAFWMDTATGHWGFIPATINILGPGSARPPPRGRAARAGGARGAARDPSRPAARLSAVTVSGHGHA